MFPVRRQETGEANAEDRMTPSPAAMLQEAPVKVTKKEGSKRERKVKQEVGLNVVARETEEEKDVTKEKGEWRWGVLKVGRCAMGF